MFRILRGIHLCAAAFSLPFLAMYAISAIQMAHWRWFDMKPAVTEQTVALTPGLTDARVAVRELISKHGVAGELRSVAPSEGRLQFRVVRPGTVYEANYSAANGATKLKTQRAGWLGMLNRLHHSEGTWHEYWQANAWSAMAGLISAGLFVLGASGLYLWFKNRRERRLGLALTLAALAVTIPLIVSMRWF